MMMKSMFYFLLALTVVSAATENDSEPVPVLDVDGDPVLGGHSYYVVPVVNGKGGGLTLSGLGGKKCPLYIVQESSEVNDGILVKFSDWKSQVGYVPEKEELRVEMDIEDTICCQRTYWTLDTKQWFLMAGPEGKSSGFFLKFERSGDGYKFVWCPSIDRQMVLCENFGISVDEKGIRRMAFSSEPFLVKFKKADMSQASV